jgi:D-alanyl-lipoteichoic acid acyltransferase DltB (MBOAT superfamily)
MYIPMGGSKKRLLNVWPIFTFVALWHDFEWHLLKWAWLMALFIAPEVLCKSIIHRPKWRKQWHRAWFQHLCAAAAAAYIMVCPFTLCSNEVNQYNLREMFSYEVQRTL